MFGFSSADFAQHPSVRFKGGIEEDLIGRISKESAKLHHFLDETFNLFKRVFVRR